MPRHPPLEALTRTTCTVCEGSGSLAPNERDIAGDDPEDVVCGECGGSGWKEKWRRIAVGTIHYADRP